MTHQFTAESLTAVDSRSENLTTEAVLLSGGQALLIFEGAGDMPPRSGQMLGRSGTVRWQAEIWAKREGAGWCGIALAGALPPDNTMLFDSAGDGTWNIVLGPRVDISVTSLIEMTRATGADPCHVFRFLAKTLCATSPSDSGSAECLAHQTFLRDFLTIASDRDGFIEVLAEPLTGGLFMQGWAKSLGNTSPNLIGLPDQATPESVITATFDRDDLLAPASGFCLFHTDLQASVLIKHQAAYFEKEGRLLRLDVVASALSPLSGMLATDHIVQMLPRLQAGPGALCAFRRICRPRFRGEDTLSGTELPIAVGFDALHCAPDGTMLVTGWLLDPEGHVRHTLIKSLQNRYGRISDTWVRLTRPDLNSAFAVDPRFSGLLDIQDVMHGFIVHIPPAALRYANEEIYLELVLNDERCLFQPLKMTAVDTAERLPQLLAGVGADAPDLARIVDEHLVPFLTQVRPLRHGRRRSEVTRPIPLGARSGEAPVAALMPYRHLAELQPVFSLLAGTRDADLLDLTLIAPRLTAQTDLRALEQAFRFYGLNGSFVLAPETGAKTAWLDRAAEQTAADHLLCWLPQALPKAPGWVSLLMADARGLTAPGIMSPSMTYEDGSVYYRPAEKAALTQATVGSSAVALPQVGPIAMPAAAAEITLIMRAQLNAVGGFTGHMFSDDFAHLDLSFRLKRAGITFWCSENVEFWMLDDAPPPDPAPLTRILRRIDAGLLARRGGPPLYEIMP